jgi:dTDP-4-dehydrorhamnose 3,5-epimerase
MKTIETILPGLLLLEPQVFGDDRGFFYESYNERAFRAATGLDVHFVQDNHSRSVKGVLRGLHYQLPPAAQGKLVRCVSGEVFDVAVDLRRESPTLGRWFGVQISAENKREVWIPEGFAHGFLVLSEFAEFLYKTTNYYAPQFERAVVWNDPDLAIDWPLSAPPLLSNKDAAAPRFIDAELFPGYC